MKNTSKSIGAILAGLVLIFALSIITDLVLEKTAIMKLPFDENSFLFIVFVVLYRNIYVSAGGYLTAALAPAKPMKHAMILAAIGCVLGIAGTVAMWHLPPHWYPISLVILGWPSTWIGARWRIRKMNRNNV